MGAGTTTIAASAAPRRARTARMTPRRALLLPAAFSAGLALFALLPVAWQSPRLQGSILAAAAALLLATGALRSRLGRRSLVLEIQPKPQHYVQACAQSIVLLYWGWYWRPVYDALPLLAAQLVFAYAVDILVSWWRRDTYVLGFAPFPVIFSINLFLWFKPDWFYLQFLMIAVGFLAKELIRWEKDGRRAHVFNPSSFPLALFSVGLLLTGTTSWTYGPEIARTQFNPPNIYLLLFLVGLPGQFLFGVTTMTMSAVVTTYLFGLVYFWLTGSYFFIDSYIPVAVFLGMHLLFTDPSTSPRTELGRITFGVLYGLGNIVLYELLGQAGLPTFYDKLLPVPILNLSIKLIDRFARSAWIRTFDPARLGAGLTPKRRNLAYITVWVLVFAGMSRVDAIGDNHEGHTVPFWQQACTQDARNACDNLALILDTYCRDGSGWACNEVGVLRWHGRATGADRVPADFLQACGLGFSTGCRNGFLLKAQGTPLQAPPAATDYPVVLRTGKGALPDQTPLELLTRACDQGWPTGCDELGGLYLRGEGVPRDPVRAAAAFDRACGIGLATACSNAGLMHYTGDGLPRDRQKGLDYLKRACDRGFSGACDWMKDPERALRPPEPAESRAPETITPAEGRGR